MKKHAYFLWMAIFSLPFISCVKDKINCDPNDEESPCYDGLPGGGGNAAASECWYKVIIDGETVQPNKFGKDRVVLTTAVDAETQERVFAFRIDQAKTGSGNAAVLIAMGRALLNSKLPKGSYPGALFSTTSFSTPAYAQWPYYLFADDDSEKADNLTVNLVENSDKQVWVKISGNVTKLKQDNVNVGIVPVEAEIKIGRKHYAEMNTNGNLVGDAVCDCQN